MSAKAIDQAEWRPLYGIDKVRLSEARLQAHYAAQWLARAARAYVPPQPDDGHTSLSWDRVFDGFVTHPLKGGMRLSLQVTNLSLALRDGDGTSVVESIFLNGRSDAQVRQWLGDKLSKIKSRCASSRLTVSLRDPCTRHRSRQSIRRSWIGCCANGAYSMVLKRGPIAQPHTGAID